MWWNETGTFDEWTDEMVANANPFEIKKKNEKWKLNRQKQLKFNEIKLKFVINEPIEAISIDSMAINYWIKVGPRWNEVEWSWKFWWMNRWNGGHRQPIRNVFEKWQ